MEIATRTALLTGATGGLGRAIARRLAADGATLVLSGRREADLLELAESLPGEDHRVVVADLAEDGAAERLAEAAAGVDILVANAGLPGAGWLAEFSADEVKRALRVNLEAPMLLARALCPAMLERGGGALVFVSSLSGKSATPAARSTTRRSSACAASRSACAPTSARAAIGVSLVSPGFVRDAGMFADTGAKTPPMIGTTTPTRSPTRSSGRSSTTRSRSPSPRSSPGRRPRRPGQPARSRLAPERQRRPEAAAAVADGHSKDKR